MCEYCGCRELDPEIGALGEEHDAIVELSDRILRELEAGEITMQDAVTRLRELLIPHVQREEGGIFRVAEEMGLGNEYVYDLEGDHLKFDSDLSLPGDLDRAALESVLDDLYRHIAVEEYDLFPVVARRTIPKALL
jgi:hypothetical protein